MRNKTDKNLKSKKNNMLKTTINVIEYLIIFLVIFVNGMLIFKSAKFPNKTPSIFGKKAFVIISGSMIPTINIGDITIVNDTNNVNVGDVIAFRRDSTVIVHRIIKEMIVNGNSMYQTKGDNNEAADIELVGIPSIEGVMIGKIPFIGKILMWLYNNLAIVVVICVIIIVLKYYFYRD